MDQASGKKVLLLDLDGTVLDTRLRLAATIVAEAVPGYYRLPTGAPSRNTVFFRMFSQGHARPCKQRGIALNCETATFPLAFSYLRHRAF